MRASGTRAGTPAFPGPAGRAGGRALWLRLQGVGPEAQGGVGRPLRAAVWAAFLFTSLPNSPEPQRPHWPWGTARQRTQALCTQAPCPRASCRGVSSEYLTT